MSNIKISLQTALNKIEINPNNIKKVLNAYKRGRRVGLRKAGNFMVDKIHSEMYLVKTGTLYIPPQWGLKKRHRASNRSGKESSAIYDGKLHKSIYTQSSGANSQIIGADAKIAPHAATQEFGGTNSLGKKIAPRNNISRPLRQNKLAIRNKIIASINQSLKKL